MKTPKKETCMYLPHRQQILPESALLEKSIWRRLGIIFINLTLIPCIGTFCHRTIYVSYIYVVTIVDLKYIYNIIVILVYIHSL